jgi:hypothetical protein
MMHRLAVDSSINRWLQQVAPAWHLEVGEAWLDEDTDGTTFSLLRAPATSDIVVGAAQLPPVQVLTKVSYGCAAGTTDPSVQVEVVVKFAMDELTTERTHAHVKHPQSPLPSALTLTELNDLLVSLLKCRSIGEQAWELLYGADTLPPSAQTQITLYSGDGMARVVQIGDATVPNPAKHPLYEVPFKSHHTVDPRNPTQREPLDADVAATVVLAWAATERRFIDQDIDAVRYPETHRDSSV